MINNAVKLNMLIASATILAGLMLGAVSAQAQQIMGIQAENALKSEVEIEKFYEEDEDEEEAVLFVDEPFFKEVTFLNLEHPRTFQGRIDRLLYGIYTDVAPEYDHFGYEIRRYMAGVGLSLIHISEPTRRS